MTSVCVHDYSTPYGCLEIIQEANTYHPYEKIVVPIHSVCTCVCVFVVIQCPCAYNVSVYTCECKLLTYNVCLL